MTETLTHTVRSGRAETCACSRSVTSRPARLADDAAGWSTRTDLERMLFVFVGNRL